MVSGRPAGRAVIRYGEDGPVRNRFPRAASWSLLRITKRGRETAGGAPSLCPRTIIALRCAPLAARARGKPEAMFQTFAIKQDARTCFYQHYMSRNFTVQTALPCCLRGQMD